MRKPGITEIISALYIFLFTYAAASKLMEFQKFKVQLGQSPLLSTFSGFIAWGIPLFEILVAAMLTTNKFRSAGLYASLFLMSMFTAYIIVITKFSEFIPCSCGGVLQQLSWNQHLIFNTVFILLALIALTKQIGNYKTLHPESN